MALCNNGLYCTFSCLSLRQFVGQQLQRKDDTRVKNVVCNQLQKENTELDAVKFDKMTGNCPPWLKLPSKFFAQCQGGCPTQVYVQVYVTLFR